MSKIDKLSIQGIRSFGPKDVMAIQLHTPLTLIVGTNGSGKTTIIECLKFATTGVLPPNTKTGGAFIHDPQMAGEKEVMAQVKISFLSTEKTQVVCTRNLSLTVKANTRSFKQMEGAIRMIKNGERNTISSRVGELDTMMPRYLGVSKAVLENVIFCHQEDSLWPLSEPKPLKEKFDQIFEAQKYTKAIDNIKILQKNKKIELLEQKKHEEHMKSNNEKAKKLRKRMEELDEQYEKLSSERDDFSNQQHEATRKTEEFWKKMGAAELIVGELVGKRITRQGKEESVQTLRENLNEMSDTDEELQAMLEQYEERIQLHEEDLEKHKVHYQQGAEDVDSARSKLGAKEREVGSHEAQKENFDRHIDNRKKLIRETARSYNIRGYDLEIDDSLAKDFMQRITKTAREHEAKWKRSRDETQENLQREQRELNRISGETSGQKQSKETSRQTIASYDRKIGDLQSQQNRMNIDEGGKVLLESQLQEMQGRLEKAKAELQNATWDADIDSADKELRTLSETKDKLESEFMEASRRAGDTAQLDFLQKEVKDRERSQKTMIDAHSERINKVIGDAWTAATVERDFSTAVNDSMAQVTEAQNQKSGTERESDYLNAKIKENGRELEAAQAELKDAERAIRSAFSNPCEPQDYHEALKEVEADLFAFKGEKESFEKVRDFLQSCVSTAKQHNACKTCMRAFQTPKELETMLNKVDSMLDTYKSDASATDLESVEAELKAAKAAASDYETWERLKHKVIPEKQRQATRLEQDRQELDTQLEKQDLAVAAKQENKREVDAISRTVQTISGYHSEITKYQAQIQDLTSKQQSAGLSRGMEAIQVDKKKADNEMKTQTQRKTEAVTNKDRTRTQISNLELQVSDTKGKLSTADFQLKEKASLQSQEEEYKVLAAQERERISKADAKLRELDSERSTVQARYDDIAERGAEQDREMQNTSTKLTNSVDKLKMAEQEIQAYHDRGGDEPLNRCRREIELAKSELQRKIDEQSDVVRTIKKLEEQLRNHDDTKRSIVDNQRFRRDRRQLDDLCREIAELEKHNAEADKERYERDAKSWQQRRNEMAAKQASHTGEMKSIDDQLKHAQKEWDTDYKNAKENYRTAHIMVETTKAAIADLGQYGGALDKAIMKYHSLKMEAINRIVQELWRSTYQGTDVDTILIRSESETVRANKNYNYRVCMIKQDTEMDMRGRCSAGQKVLASIIIRLALAECFGIQCGLIALDEPTTNLDQENIKALATSLSEIIRHRRAQNNFQIIVITHDEEFLRMMGSHDFTDTYYRVSRDQYQNSVIDKQRISDIL